MNIFKFYAMIMKIIFLIISTIQYLKIVSAIGILLKNSQCYWNTCKISTLSMFIMTYICNLGRFYTPVMRLVVNVYHDMYLSSRSFLYTPVMLVVVNLYHDIYLSSRSFLHNCYAGGSQYLSGCIFVF